MKKKRIVAIIVLVLVLALSLFLFDQFRWRPLQQVLETDRWVRLETVRAYGEANQNYELELTLEDVKNAVFGRLAQKGNRMSGLPAPAVWWIVHTEDGDRIECGVAGDGTILVNSECSSRLCPTWKTDGTVYAALTGDW